MQFEKLFPAAGQLVPPAEKAALRTEMLGAIKADDMAPLFEQLGRTPRSRLTTARSSRA